MVDWIETNEHVYSAIYREHGDKFGVFESCTAPEGNRLLGIFLPYMLTMWGFKGADEPLIRSIATKNTMEQEKYDYKFYIALVRKDNDDD